MYGLRKKWTIDSKLLEAIIDIGQDKLASLFGPSIIFITLSVVCPAGSIIPACKKRVQKSVADLFFDCVSHTFIYSILIVRIREVS